MKKFVKLISIAMVLLLTFSMFACSGDSGSGSNGGSDDSKTHIYVFNFDGGVGTDWLYNAKSRFEALYSDYSFAENKKGVVVEITPSKSALDSIASATYNIYFTEQVNYNDLVAQNLILDISDVVTSPLTNVKGCTESGSIQDKLYPEQKTALKAVGDKYYVLPHYECYSGVSYDVDLFDSESFYIEKNSGSGTTTFTNKSGNLSVGPDGVSGTYDDGLPSSYEEFYALLAKMRKTVVPFIYCGKYTTYTNNLVTGLWSTYTGKDEFMLNVNFDSNYYSDNTVKTEIITGFNGDIPIVEEKEIEPSTGYLISQQAGKYYALDFLSTIMKEGGNFSDKIGDTLTHLGAQEEYIFSSLESDSTPIAMIIEGSYWYNEAKSALEESETLYPTTGVNRNFSYMPLPIQLTGQVQEGQGKKNTLLDVLSSYAFINANIKDNKELVDASKAFLQFVYTDSELLNFTKDTSVFKGVKYNVDRSVFDSMSKYASNLFDIRSNSDVIHPISDSPIFINSQSKYNFAATSDYWKSLIDKTNYAYPRTAFANGKTAESYFLGMKETESSWNNQFSQYFNK